VIKEERNSNEEKITNPKKKIKTGSTSIPPGFSPLKTLHPGPPPIPPHPGLTSPPGFPSHTSAPPTEKIVTIGSPDPNYGDQEQSQLEVQGVKGLESSCYNLLVPTQIISFIKHFLEQLVNMSVI
jgi:hypothetical protein